MTRSTISLHDLAQRISKQQAELAKLRQEYEARQGHLQKLMRRKEDLQTQIQQVEAEIQGLGHGAKPPESKPSAGATAAKPAPTKPRTKPSGNVTLAQLLVQIVATAGGPLTVKDLVRELARRKYSTTSQNLARIVKNRLSQLVKQRLLRRAPNRQGVLPAQAPPAAKAPAAKSASGAPGTKQKTPAVAGAKTTTPAAAASALTLPAVVTKILAGSPEPIPGRELAEKVLASGYQTKSKNFLNVIWVGVGKMANVENVPGQGYRLKKGKTAAAASTGTGKGSK